jgi:hypothetical protein
MSLLLTLCGGDDLPESTTVISDQECLSASEIKEIELNISESEISLGNGETIEELNAILENLQSELTELKNFRNQNSQYIEELIKQIENLKMKTGVNYDDVDFENFGQDSIIQELFDGTISVLEAKPSLTEEEKEKLILAQDKLNLLNATTELYLQGNDDPRVSQLEEEIIEIEKKININSPDNESELEEIQEFITAQENLLSSFPPCDDIVISADGADGADDSLLDLLLLFTEQKDVTTLKFLVH